MKKYHHGLLIILLFIIILGIVSIIVDFFSKEKQLDVLSNLNNLTSNVYDAQELEATHHEETFSADSLLLETNGIVYLTSSDSVLEPTISYFEFGNYYDLEVSDNTIILIRKAGYLEHMEQFPIVITLPLDYPSFFMTVKMEYGSLNIENLKIHQSDIQIDSGSLNITDSTLIDSQLTIDTGNLTINNSRLSNVESSVDAGNIKINGILHGAIKSKVNVGNIIVETPYFTEMFYNLSVDVGKIYVEDVNQHQNILANEIGNPDTQLDLSVDLGNIELGQ